MFTLNLGAISYSRHFQLIKPCSLVISFRFCPFIFVYLSLFIIYLIFRKKINQRDVMGQAHHIYKLENIKV